MQDDDSRPFQDERLNGSNGSYDPAYEFVDPDRPADVYLSTRQPNDNRSWFGEHTARPDQAYGVPMTATPNASYSYRQRGWEDPSTNHPEHPGAEPLNNEAECAYPTSFQPLTTEDTVHPSMMPVGQVQNLPLRVRHHNDYATGPVDELRRQEYNPNGPQTCTIDLQFLSNDHLWRYGQQQESKLDGHSCTSNTNSIESYNSEQDLQRCARSPSDQPWPATKDQYPRQTDTNVACSWRLPSDSYTRQGGLESTEPWTHVSVVGPSQNQDYMYGNLHCTHNDDDPEDSLSASDLSHDHASAWISTARGTSTTSTSFDPDPRHNAMADSLATIMPELGHIHAQPHEQIRSMPKRTHGAADPQEQVDNTDHDRQHTEFAEPHGPLRYFGILAEI
jgi:hypothetical protein